VDEMITELSIEERLKRHINQKKLYKLAMVALVNGPAVYIQSLASCSGAAPQQYNMKAAFISTLQCLLSLVNAHGYLTIPSSRTRLGFEVSSNTPGP
jgi:hypothetical protein